MPDSGPEEMLVASVMGISVSGEGGGRHTAQAVSIPGTE